MVGQLLLSQHVSHPDSPHVHAHEFFPGTLVYSPSAKNQHVLAIWKL